ncbi:MAG: glycosyltransferase family 4 protein [bacterium]|nr:glycosyltransferase family 4 protein [bacterium]
MRILVIYMYYLRPGDPGIRRFNQFCQVWAEQTDVQVIVVTSQIHHPSKSVYPDIGSQRIFREMDGKVEVLRVAGPNTYHAGFKGRAWSQLGWADNVRRLLPTLQKQDIVLASSPPLFVAQPLLAAQKYFGIPAILEVRDMWPEAITQLKIASPRHPAVLYFGWIERRACCRADHVVTIVETQKNSIVRRGLKRAEDVSVITNGVMLEEVEAVPSEARAEYREKLGVRDGELLALYVGSHGPLHNLITLVELADELRGRKDIRIVSLGEGPERQQLEAEAARRGLTNLRFAGSVAAHKVAAYISAADIGLSLVNTTAGTNWDNQTRGVFRNAFFDLAGAKLPIVFNVPGYSRDEIEDRAKAGIFADTNGGPAEIAAAVRQLADDPILRRQLGENGYRELAVKYNRRKMAGEYLELMRRLIGL